MDNITNVDTGIIMTCFDIHGNWNDYQQAKARFKELKQQGKADLLVFGGDFIHAYPGYPDKSLEILDDIMQNPKKILALLGNHELIHIYHLNLCKDDIYFVSPLEEKINADREKYIKFMKQMPFAVKTSGGVLINHAGAFRTKEKNSYDQISNINHDELFRHTKKRSS